MNPAPLDAPASPYSPADIPLPLGLRQKVKDGLVALSLSNLLQLGSLRYVLSDVDLDYYKKLPLTQATLLGMAANLFGLALLIWLGVRAWRRWRNRWFQAACEWMFLLLCCVVLEYFLEALLRIPKYDLVMLLKKPVIAVGILLLWGCVAWRRRWVVRVAAILIGIMSPLAFMNLGRIALASFGPNHPLHCLSEPAPAPLRPMREGHPRAIWMVLDEADQRLAFDQRPATLQMPEFDRLRLQCLYATNAYPPGSDTDVSLPGLIAGRRISVAKPKSAFDLAVTLSDTGEVVAWSELPSVFDAARDLGANTALVGWFHPYGRILGGRLNYCSWYPYPFYQKVRALTICKAMKNEIGCLAGRLHFRKLYAEMCHAMLADSISVATNADYGLVFVHFALPHLPGIYDPATGRFPLKSLEKVPGYFNNLALLDLMFGKLRQAMESSGQWDKVWLILSSDHSWRSSRLYDGQRDLRVPFIIKAPGDGQAILYSAEVNTVITHDLILAILRGNLTNQQQSVAWLDAHRSKPPPAPKPSARE